MKNNRIIFRIILALLWAGIGIFRTEGKNVLKGLDMTLDKNSIIGLLGLNGSDKTTLMNVICGLHDAYHTEAMRQNFTEKKPHSVTMTSKKRYIVFSEDDSFGYFTFDEYIRFVFKTYRKKINEQETDELIRKFNFSEYRNSTLPGCPSDIVQTIC